MAVALYGWNDGRNEEAALILQRFVGWAAPQIGHSMDLPRTACIALVEERRLDIIPMAVVVYYNYEPACRALEIGMAASTPRWATKGNIKTCLSYPFDRLGCGVVVCRTARRATRTKRFLSGIGFKNCGTVPRGMGDDDLSIYAMTREQAARWLDKPEGINARAA